MEVLSVKEVVRENKRNLKSLSVFMDERIVRSNGELGPRLDQFLAGERQMGLYPLLGGAYYKPLQEGVIVTAPKSWGITTPNELVGALVGVRVIGSIPVAEDRPEHGEIHIVRLTEPDDGDGPVDWVRAGGPPKCDTDLHLGWDVWVDYPLGIPTAFPEEEEPDSDSDSAPDSDDDDEGYW